MNHIFADRNEAGKKLAEKLLGYKDKNLIILAMPRGGVPVGFEVARTLNAPLDVVIARKLGMPENPEYGIGAVAEGGVKILTADANLASTELDELIKKEGMELERRKELYRQGKELPNLKNKTVILVDDGLATGVTARASIEAILKKGGKKIIFAAPVCAADSTEILKEKADKVECLHAPEEFLAVGLWYKDFPQVTDGEVTELLAKANNLK